MELIRIANEIEPGRGSLITEQPCAHVEIEPFGPVTPTTRFRRRMGTPSKDLGIPEDGAYVEFDLPRHLPFRITTGIVGPRNTGEIMTYVPLSLEGLNATFVKIELPWWYFLIAWWG